jgi:lactam utilization protein B
MKLIWDAIKRTVALVGTEVALIMAAGSVMEIEAWKAAVVAGLSAAMSVWASIGRAYYKDGKLTKDEVDDAFSTED